MQKYCWVKRDQYSDIRENIWNDIFRPTKFHLERESQTSIKLLFSGKTTHLETCPFSVQCRQNRGVCMVLPNTSVSSALQCPFKKLIYVHLSNVYINKHKILCVEAKNYFCKEQIHLSMTEKERILRQ